MEYAVAIFSCTHDAMCAEKFLRERLSVQIMPTPRAISASCGISVRFSPADVKQALALLPELGVKTTLYGIDAQGIPTPIGTI